MCWFHNTSTCTLAGMYSDCSFFYKYSHNGIHHWLTNYRPTYEATEGKLQYIMASLGSKQSQQIADISKSQTKPMSRISAAYAEMRYVPECCVERTVISQQTRHTQECKVLRRTFILKISSYHPFLNLNHPTILTHFNIFSINFSDI